MSLRLLGQMFIFHFLPRKYYFWASKYKKLFGCRILATVPLISPSSSRISQPRWIKIAIQWWHSFGNEPSHSKSTWGNGKNASRIWSLEHIRFRLSDWTTALSASLGPRNVDFCGWSDCISTSQAGPARSRFVRYSSLARLKSLHFIRYFFF